MKFLDISKQDLPIKNEIITEIRGVIEKNDFILGEKVEQFEKNFSKFSGSKYSVGCGNGTDALILALETLNLPKNSEVIVPAMTWCSTAIAVLKANLKPVLVDIQKNSSTICLNSLKKKISRRTKVLIMVHLYGQCCDIKKIKKIIKNKNIFVIEDAAQAHGAYYYNPKNKVGNLGDMTCYSFYPGKNLGAYGDAGLITTNKKKYFDKLIKMRNMGQKTRNKHDIIGINSRLDTVQAAILNIKLKSLRKNNNLRKKIANFYNKNLNNKYIEKLNYTKGCVYHQYVIKVRKLKKFIEFLNYYKIPFSRHYPKPIHKLYSLKPFFKNEVYKNAEELSKSCISLPVNPLLKKKELSYICECINKFN